MKFAFSSLCCPDSDPQALADMAKQFGYDGVELQAGGIAAANPIDLRRVFPSSPAVVSLSTSIAYAQSARADGQSAQQLRSTIDIANSLACPLVKINDMTLRGGQHLSEAASAYARWLAPLADYAADRGITILIENALGFRRAGDLWLILEFLNHPAVGVCWNVLNAALAGESPAVSIPTLNARIQIVHVADALVNQHAASFCNFGEGTVRLANLMQRLMGIGYDGWVSFEWNRKVNPALAPAETILPQVIAKLRDWTKPPVIEKPAKPAAKTAAAKPAAAKDKATPAAPAVVAAEK